ncbi:restriction endonuclease [Tsuneonella dongtanensis]|uniref:restriction endonuclease n=1 Tax=Tsuneonella dongtanensis TaxID=692370 RepID=UPI0008336800|nr:restriction endonuclease [Tsuneonella dongtanensis]
MLDLFPDDESETQPVAKLQLPRLVEFSPGTLEHSDVQRIVREVAAANGDKSKAVASIVKTYPRIASKAAQKQVENRAANVLRGMAQCGLIQRNGSRVTADLTDVGEAIRSAPSASDASDIFSKHLLENCFGSELLDIVASLRARGLDLTVESIRDELALRGFQVNENEGNASKMRLWLEASGVIDKDWNVDEPKLTALVGASSTVLTEWHGLPREQRVFLEVLKEAAGGMAGGWHPVRKIKKIAEARYGARIFPTGRLRDRVITPLKIGGWLDTRGTGTGRGGDSGDVQPLKQLIDISIKLPVEELGSVPADLRRLLATPLDRIFSDLKSSDKGIKGKALELLALNIIADLGLIPVGFRVRSSKTNGAEVDLIAESTNAHFSRWLFQCKNTPTKALDVDQIAKEVGMALVLNAHVVVLVTTGRVGKVVQQFAAGIARSSALQCVLIDGAMLKAYKLSRGAGLLDALNKAAVGVLHLKRTQIQTPD